ncbi:MAG: hypothetical protein PHW96_00315 [Candidatus Nanoarchaeia archaeon]|nr:hypothetical protein [Candidatus Nanoarchaeia archaeon]
MAQDSQLVIDSTKDFVNLIDERTKKAIELSQGMVKEAVETEMDLFKFEMLYAVTVPKTQREKTVKQIRTLRDTEWKKAIKEADGDEQKAFAIYCNDF